MPNWMEGTLKIRGKKEDKERFIKEGLGPCAGEHSDDPDYFIKYKELDKDFGCWNIREDTYVKDTKRMFVADSIELWIEPEIDITFIPIKQAWALIPEDFLQIAKKYNLDLRITGFEMGLGFSQEIEILKGEITICKGDEYKDYWWECPCPTLGG